LSVSTSSIDATEAMWLGGTYPTFRTVYFTQVQEGTDYYQRIGRKIKLIMIELKLHIYGSTNSLTLETFDNFMYGFIIGKKGKNDTPYAASNPLNYYDGLSIPNGSVGGYNNAKMWMKTDDPQRMSYKIWWKKRGSISTYDDNTRINLPVGNWFRERTHIIKPKNMIVEWAQGDTTATEANVVRNLIYFFHYSDAGATPYPQIGYAIKFWYTDV